MGVLRKPTGLSTPLSTHRADDRRRDWDAESEALFREIMKLYEGKYEKDVGKLEQGGVPMIIVDMINYFTDEEAK